ncbi:unnamed protein product [Caenorhabditis sp. 36 PRJEB53466]|nr:unnamed protein product [Caenorhabditis sp. 36 PRJEB53466]
MTRSGPIGSPKAACEVMNRYLSSLFVLDDVDQITVTLWGDEDPIGEKKIDWGQLVDTRDFNAIPFCETPDYIPIMDDMRERTFKELVQFLSFPHFYHKRHVPGARSRGPSDERKHGAPIGAAPTENHRVQGASGALPQRISVLFHSVETGPITGNFLCSHWGQMMAIEDENVPSKVGEDLGKVRETI